MSHLTSLSGLSIKSATAIKAAVLDLQSKGIKIELLENATPRMYYEKHQNRVKNIDFVLKLKDSRYDVGLKLEENGEYSLHLDEYDNDIRKLIGTSHQDSSWDQDEKHLAHIQQFNLAYSKALITEQFNAKEIYDVSFDTVEDGYVMTGVAA